MNITADLDQLARFVDALFPYAADDTIVLLRAFSGDEPWRQDLWRPVRLGPDRTPLINAAALLATQAANAETPVTFCPPIATFSGYRASADNLADGLVLSVECDTRPDEARSKLEDLLGQATVIVASGGEWTNPATGEVQDKLHLHWRLSVPARTPEEHANLKLARRLAQLIVGADATGVPPVHPLRWPGSWHRKGTPRLARIVGGDPERETVLSEALMILRDVIGEISEGEHQPGEPQAPMEQLEAAMIMLPNADKPWEEWNRIGMALFAATGGSEQGLALFQHWSAKSSKYSEAPTKVRWEHYHRSPPTRIGAGTIFYAAAVEWVEPDFPDPDDWDPVWPEEIAPNGAASAPTPKSNGAATQVLKPTGAAHPHNEVASEGTASTQAPKPNGACTPTPAPPPEPGWPVLIDITATGNRVPPFPTALLPQPFRNFVEDIADRLQVPPCFPAIPTVISVATVLGRGVRLQPKRHDYKWTERACLWGVLISKVSARKTPATSEALAPICKIQSELMERYRAELALWKLNEERGDKPVPERLLTNDSTVETLCRLMTTEHNANPRGLLLYRDELSGWLASMNQYKPGGQGADRQFYLQCWSGGQHIADRMTETRYVDDAYLNIFGSIQPDIVAASFRGGEKDGMTARIGLGAYPDMPNEIAWVDRKPNTDAVDRVVDRLVGLRGLEGRLVKFDGPAYSIFEGWSLRNANRVELRDDTSFATHVAKYPALFARLALVLHFMQHGPAAPNEVAEDTAEAARKLVDDYFEPHARKIYGVLEADPAKPGAVKIAEWIRKKNVMSFNVPRDVRRQGFSEFKKEPVEVSIIAAGKYLEAMGWVRIDEKPAGARGGRPTMVARVNPEVLACK